MALRYRVYRARVLEQVGRRMLVDELLKFNSPDTFLRAVLCLLCASLMPQVRVTCSQNDK